MTAKTTTFFVVLYRVNIRALAEFTDKVLKYLYYYMGRSGTGSRVGHNIEFVYGVTYGSTDYCVKSRSYRVSRRMHGFRGYYFD